MKHEDWGWLGERLGLQLNDPAIDLLGAYEALLRERAIPAGMIARGDEERIRERHLVDSLRGARELPPSVRRVVDLGSGAGLPGIPISIARPDLDMTLVEPRRGRAAFLELVVDRLRLPRVHIHQGRAEDLRIQVDAGLARAFAAPARAWELAEPLLTVAGVLVYWAGTRLPAWPAGVDVDLRPHPDLANSGPIAIMTRQ